MLQLVLKLDVKIGNLPLEPAIVAHCRIVGTNIEIKFAGAEVYLREAVDNVVTVFLRGTAKQLDGVMIDLNNVETVGGYVSAADIHAGGISELTIRQLNEGRWQSVLYIYDQTIGQTLELVFADRVVHTDLGDLTPKPNVPFLAEFITGNRIAEEA